MGVRGVGAGGGVTCKEHFQNKGSIKLHYFLHAGKFLGGLDRP